MFKKLFKKFQEKRQRELLEKFYELRYYITKFFEDLQITKGTVELPAWVECKNLMEKMEIDIQHPKNINFYYKRLQRYKLANNL